MHNFIEFSPLNDTITKFYPYRTAVVTDWVIKIHLTQDDMWYLRHTLEDAGYQIDNHIVFTTEAGAFWLHDNWLYVGKTVKEGSY